MASLTIEVNTRTEQSLRELSLQSGDDVAKMAARLLARAVRAARPRPKYDIEALIAANAEFAEEDLALAESRMEERAALLAQEDTL